MPLSGKTAFITGAGSGIGRATCRILARDGANVIAADINEESARGTINLIDRPGLRNISLPLDVKEESSVKKALKNILLSYTKPPSIIVNCAAIARGNYITKLSEADFQEVLDVNLKGTFLVMQIFSNAIIEHKVSSGTIINISSVVTKIGLPGHSNYVASKGGIRILTKTAAGEFKKEGIRVNAVLPGFIETPMTDPMSDKVKTATQRMIPLGRFGKPEEVGEVIAFLASEKSSYINGASIDVNGGLA